MKITPAIFPPHIARAYGVRAQAPAAKVTPTDGASQTDSIARIAPAKPSGVASLVARVVPGSISFAEDGTAMPKAPARPFYTHPADANAAATGVALGRSIDVSG
ncbi:MAG: hypothetical protein H6814_00205 [Phycisphaeraceae bacterium]|nr:hypothetical protein [Phycisphaeraceae bacterium]